MSRGDAVEFVGRMIDDPALTERVCQADPREAIDIAAEAGLSVTEAEVSDVITELMQAHGELDEAALEAVTGGVNFAQNHAHGMVNLIGDEKAKSIVNKMRG